VMLFADMVVEEQVSLGVERRERRPLAGDGLARHAQPRLDKQF